MAGPKDNSYRFGVLLVRIVLGLILLTQGWGDIQEHTPTAKSIHSVVEGTVDAAPGPFGWIGGKIEKHPATFAWIVRWGSFLGGLALVIGALVRPFGWLTGIAYLIAFFLGKPDQEHFHLLAAAGCIACALMSAGSRWGLDSIFDPAVPAWLSWKKGGGKDRPFG